MALDRLSVIPYQLALRDALDAALFRLEELEASTSTCLTLRAELFAQNRADPDTFAARTRQNTHVRDDLECFLAAWARVSLLLFPSRQSARAKLRAQTLQGLFGLDGASPLASRGLRDSWMHFDERLDAAIGNGAFIAPAQFTVSADVTPDLCRNVLVVVELDTNRIHYHGQATEHCSVLLSDLKAALNGLHRAQNAAFDGLPMPQDAT